eukprot:scaffold12033_cov125-Isochrysis_galbana.AAC.9
MASASCSRLVIASTRHQSAVGPSTACVSPPTSRCTAQSRAIEASTCHMCSRLRTHHIGIRVISAPVRDGSRAHCWDAVPWLQRTGKAVHVSRPARVQS